MNLVGGKEGGGPSLGGGVSRSEVGKISDNRKLIMNFFINFIRKRKSKNVKL